MLLSVDQLNGGVHEKELFDDLVSIVALLSPQVAFTVSRRPLAAFVNFTVTDVPKVPAATDILDVDAIAGNVKDTTPDSDPNDASVDQLSIEKKQSKEIVLDLPEECVYVLETAVTPETLCHAPSAVYDIDLVL